MGNKTPLNPELMAKDKNVIIIGGGDTGCDCIATSLRQVCSLYYYIFVNFIQFKVSNIYFGIICLYRELNQSLHSKSYQNHPKPEQKIILGHNSPEYSKWIMDTKKSYTDLAKILEHLVL